MAESRVGSGPGVRTLLVVAALYAVSLAAATYPYVTKLASDLPCGGDPPQHLWIMRWYRSCLLEGRSPLFCPELHHPVGVPLGNFSPLHVQSLLFLPLSLATGNDALAYNVIWIVGMLTTGLGTFLLAWHVVRDRAGAAAAGLLAMLSGPVMLHAHAHLELTYVGSFPFFLLAWMRLVDAPTRGRALLAAGAFLLLAACAAYFVVLAAPAAACYVAWRLAAEGRAGVWPWLWARLGGFATFVGLALPGLAFLFAGQLWAVVHGQPMARSRAEFADHGAHLWGYAAPTYLHALTRLIGRDLYAEAGYNGIRVGLVHDNGSYLGVLTILLLIYAAARRLRFDRAGFWWAALVLLVVLSMGAYTTVAGRRLGLPSLWLYRNTFAFRLIRSPARFNLFAAVIAALIAGAGLTDLLARVRRQSARGALVAALALIAVADLGMTPYISYAAAPLPRAYRLIRDLNSRATLLELPLQSSSFDTTGLDRTYWQSLHRLRTSAGYSGVNNTAYDHAICVNSPFASGRPGFLTNPEHEQFGIVADVPFADYSWLFLSAHDYSHVLMNRRVTAAASDPASLARMEAALRPAAINDDGEWVIYDVARLAPPRGPVVVCVEGWRAGFGRPGPLTFGAHRVSRLAAYNPDPNRPLTLYLAAAAPRAARDVVLRHDGRELVRWRVEPGAPRLYATPPLTLPRGRVDLVLEADGEDRPRSSREALDEGRSAFSLRVTGVSLKQAEALAQGVGAARE